MAKVHCSCPDSKGHKIGIKLPTGIRCAFKQHEGHPCAAKQTLSNIFPFLVWFGCLTPSTHPDFLLKTYINSNITTAKTITRVRNRSGSSRRDESNYYWALVPSDRIECATFATPSWISSFLRRNRFLASIAWKEMREQADELVHFSLNKNNECATFCVRLDWTSDLGYRLLHFAKPKKPAFIITVSLLLEESQSFKKRVPAMIRITTNPCLSAPIWIVFANCANPICRSWMEAYN